MVYDLWYSEDDGFTPRGSYEESCDNNCDFDCEIIPLFDGLTPVYFPDRANEPWRVQAKLGETKINFWPHKMKAHVEFTQGPAKEGLEEVLALVKKYIREYEDSELDFDPIED